MDIKRVLPAQAHELIDTEGYTYLDVRSIPEFEQGHPSGAYNIPLMHFSDGRMTPNAEFLDVVKKTFAPDTKLVIGCKSGVRSLKAAGILLAHGFSSVLDMRGGFGGELNMLGQCSIPGWAACQLPVSTSTEMGRSYEELCGKK